MVAACYTAQATTVTTKQHVRNGIIKLACQINEHGQHMQDAILLLQLRWIKKYKRHHLKSICNKLEVASKPRIKPTADWGGYATKEGENEDDKWITVTGRGKTKN